MTTPIKSLSLLKFTPVTAEIGSNRLMVLWHHVPANLGDWSKAKAEASTGRPVTHESPKTQPKGNA